ncbi:hypothetical protein GCM10011316_13580 [Roseibium aquae]|uniref:Pyrrolo-quinoline quinone repeat domain-containing protein n=1 Tax=Roseibium aquae TaxID=1323746 RepID=A0A916WYT7_9HYPH|nr:PQQ-binding-like beta-propeller repeat protein [Roseibium aquae]GGB42915.1 hypothetical protein GCM10011316_13580 [Roseibium aquae]
MTARVLTKRVRPLLALTLGAAMLTGCGSVSEFADNVNPFSREDILSGERQPVFDMEDPAAVAQARPATIGAASGGQSWPTAGGGLSNDPGNVAVSVSGAQSWKVRIGASGGGIRSSALRTASRPVSADGRIIVLKPDGDVVALSTGGSRLWNRSLRPEGENGVAPGGGVAVSGSRVYAATSFGEVVSMDAGSGQVAWRAELSGPARSAPVAGAGHVFVVTQSNEVYAIKEEDGSVAWSYIGIDEPAGILSAASPAISGDRVIVPFSSGEIMALGIKDGEPIWIDGVTRGVRTLALSGLADVSASPVVAGNMVYATGVAGRTIAASLRNGQREWSKDIGSVHTPVVSGNALFLIDLDDRLIALERTTGETLWSTRLPQPENRKRKRNWAGPVLANGSLVALSSDGYFVSVDARSGNVNTTSRVNSKVYVSPIVAGGRLVALDGDDGVAAFN